MIIQGALPFGQRPFLFPYESLFSFYLLYFLLFCIA